MKHIISLGAGVQSSTMALMAAKGELTPMPDCAIFADTGDEPLGVYKWLSWLERQLPFRVYTVSKPGGPLSKQNNFVATSKLSGRRYMKMFIPSFSEYDENGKHYKGMSMRKCTNDFKIRVIIRACREIAGHKRGGTDVEVSQWIGISKDEAHRMKPARERWIENRWPLIEKGMTRANCLTWMKSNGFPQPPRSACVYCPYHNDREWSRLKREEPDEFAKAVAFEADMQRAAKDVPQMKGVPFLHRTMKPLAEVEFDEAHTSNLFINECEGMCGV